MTTIEDLPDELLGEVVGYLDTYRRHLASDDDCEKDNLGNHVLTFCLVSRRFLHVGETVLYSFFANYPEKDEKGHRFRRHFVRRIIQRPDLAARVSEVRVGGLKPRLGHVTRDDGINPPRFDSARDWNAVPGRHFNSPADALAFLTAAQDIRMINKSKWIEGLRAGRPDAELVLLLCLARNLKCLVMVVPDQNEYNRCYPNFRAFLVQAVHAKGTGTAPLCTLRRVVIDFESHIFQSLGVQMKDLCSIFHIPSLREFVGNKITTNPMYDKDTWFGPELEVEHSETLSLASAPDDNDWDSLPSGPEDSEDSEDPEDSKDPENPEDSNTSAVSVSRRHPLGPRATLKYPVRTSPVTTLTLTCTNLLPTSFSTLLAAPAALQTLTATWADLFDYQSHEGTRSHLFNPPAVLDALALHAHTLVSLTLHVPYRLSRAPVDFGPLEDLPRIGSLKPLAALRTLSVSGLLLTGSVRYQNSPLAPGADGTGRLPPEGGYAAAADVFPAALEELLIVANAWTGGDEAFEDPGPWVVGHLSPLVGEHLGPLVVEIARVVGRRGLPALRRFRVVEGGWRSEVRAEMVGEARALLEGSGVVLELGGTVTWLGRKKRVWRDQVMWV